MDSDDKTTLSLIPRHWWPILCAIVVLAGLTLAEFMSESLDELHWLESIRGVE